MEPGEQLNSLTEKEIQSKIISALKELGWDYESQITEEYRVSPGQIISTGNQFTRGRASIVDIVLSINKDFPVAVIEIRRDNPNAGLAKAKHFAELLNVPYAFSCDGESFSEFSKIEKWGEIRTGFLTSFPSSQELWDKYRKAIPFQSEIGEKAVLHEYFKDSRYGNSRYYQRAAIDISLKTIVEDVQKRMMISLPAGSGKQFIIAQIMWKLLESGYARKILLLFERSLILETYRYVLGDIFGSRVKTLRDGYGKKEAILLTTSNSLIQVPLSFEQAFDLFDLVIIEEIPRTLDSAKSQLNILERSLPDSKILGFSTFSFEAGDSSVTSLFGKPIYSYSFKQIVEDGFSVPFQLIQFKIEENGQWEFAISDSFDEAQADLISFNVSEFLKRTNRFDKTIIFCSSIQQASLITRALIRDNQNLISQYKDYVVQITSDNPGDAEIDLRRFLDQNEKTPVIAVNVDMLTRGIDMPNCKNIVLAKRIGSIQTLLQIIAIGSRMSFDQKKNIYTVLDFSGSSSILLENPELPQPINYETFSLQRNIRFGLAEELQKKSEEPLVSLASKLHSDHWSIEDFLGYEIYAQTIEFIIRDKESNPPLTIGIIAPWGQGKTTLMRYVWRRFNSESEEESLWGVVASADQIFEWVKDKIFLRRPLKKFKAIEWNRWNPFKNKEKTTNEEFVWNSQTQLNPTIWFNPWKYQSSDQIWAGMADEIINQLVSKLPLLKREKFWLQLQWKRIDKSQIRSDIHKSLFTRLIPDILVFIVAVILWIIAFSTSGVETGNILTRLFSALLAASAAFRGAMTWWKGRKEELAKQLEQYLQSPNYSTRLGAFHHVNEDLERVFELLVSDRSPAIIFIDDLDRCSPQKVVEVIEAINLMMNGKFRQKCYFIMGMDAEMVSASIDVAYEKMQGLIPGKVDSFGSVGWYFLDKFIQLPFLIPTLRKEQKKGLIQHLFPEESQIVDISATTQAEVSKAQNIAKKATSGEIDEETQVEIKNLSPILEAEFDKAFIEEKLEENKDSSKILDLIVQYEEFLNPSPRSIKRFANLLRFHSSYQELRQAKDLEYADSDTLAYWLILSLRWPQLVRWLQWHDEKGFSTKVAMSDKINGPSTGEEEGESDEEIVNDLVSKKPMEKAAMMDEIVEHIREMADDINSYKMWEKLSQANPHLKWLADKELYLILVNNHYNRCRFTKAFECGVW